MKQINWIELLLKILRNFNCEKQPTVYSRAGEEFFGQIVLYIFLHKCHFFQIETIYRQNWFWLISN